MAIKRRFLEIVASNLGATRPTTALKRLAPVSNNHASSSSVTFIYPCRSFTTPHSSIRSFATEPPTPQPPGVKIGGERIASEGDHVSIDPHTRKRLPSHESTPQLADGKKGRSWEDDVGLDKGEDGVVRGKLSSTTTHLLRLTLPLPTPSRPVAFILHPSQPLSYLARLVAAELPTSQQTRLSDVEFRGFGQNQGVRWSDSSDIGDFVKQAAQVKSFTIGFREKESLTEEVDGVAGGEVRKEIEVLVPSFPERTVYLRDRLRKVNTSLRELGTVKEECDRLARRGAKRIAIGGLGGLVGYGGACAGLIFYGPGWDLLEPITYLVGHSVIIAGYCYWLYHQREPGYHAILDRSISTRQSALYSEKGFDLRRYQSLTSEGVRIRDEIYAIAEEYGVDWFEPSENLTATSNNYNLADTKIHREIKENERLVKRAKKGKDGDEDRDDEEDEDRDDKYGDSGKRRRKGDN